MAKHTYLYDSEADFANETATSNQFLTVREAAALARMSVAWMYRHARQLGARKHGRYVRFHRGTLISRLRDSDVRAGDTDSPPWNVKS